MRPFDQNKIKKLSGQTNQREVNSQQMLWQKVNGHKNQAECHIVPSFAFKNILSILFAKS